jgi:hypothetical protein
MNPNLSFAFPISISYRFEAYFDPFSFLARQLTQPLEGLLHSSAYMRWTLAPN